MQDEPQVHTREGFMISSDRARLDFGAALRLLHGTSWGAGMTLAVLERAAANSVCFGVYAEDERQIGFGRVVSDLATYAYLTDVVMDEAFRGRGLGKWLVECILAHPDFQSLRRVALLTQEARGLYEPFGFTEGAGVLTYLERR